MSYSKIEVCGGCNIKCLHIKNVNDENDAVNSTASNIISNTYAPTWNNDTVLLASFNKDSKTMNATALSLPDGGDLVEYQIQRYDVKTGLMTYITETPEAKLYDYNVANHKRYKYRIFPIVEKNETDSDGTTVKRKSFANYIETNEITASWDIATLIGLNFTDVENEYEVDKNNIWRLQFNLTQEQYTLNLDKTFTDGFSRFPKRGQGNKRYVKGGASFLIDNFDCKTQTIQIDPDDIDKWEEFCYSPNLKLYNDMRGRVIPVDIESSTMQYFTESSDSPVTVSFTFIQMEDAKNISVYGLDGMGGE